MNKILIATLFLFSCSKSVEINKPRTFPYSIKLNSTLPTNGNVSEKFQAASDKIVYIADESTDTVDDLFVVNVDGSNRKNLTNLSIGKKVIQFVISPDKSKIAFLADISTTGFFDLYMINLDGTNLTRINQGLTASSQTVSSNFRFTNSGNKIIYASDEIGSVRNIYIANLDGTSRTRLNTTLGVFSSFQLANDDSRVVYRNVSSNPNVYSANLTGTIENQLNSNFNLTANPAAGVQDFQISPNSQKIVYRANQDDGAIFELYTINLDGSGAKTKINGSIITGGLVSSNYRFSLDSTKIVYIADSQIDEMFELFSVNLDGTLLSKLNETLPSSGDVDSFKISEDSLKVIYIANQTSSNKELYSVNMNGSNRVKINTSLQGSESVAQFSLLGSKIFYASDIGNSGVFNIYMNDLSGSNQIKLTNATSGVGYWNNSLQTDQYSTSSSIFIGANQGSIREIFSLDSNQIVSVQGGFGVSLATTSLGSSFIIVGNYVVYRYQTNNGYELFSSLIK